MAVKVKTTSCRFCGCGEVVWVRSLAGAWRLHDARPVPFTPAVRGVVLSRSRGWLPADAVHPEPELMLRSHDCKRFVPDAHRLGDLVDDWLVFTAPVPPTPAGSRRRRRSGSERVS
jgi:hypothetical protein